MPVSSLKGKQEIKEWFATQKDIKTILDVGPGSGTYQELLGSGYHWTAIEIWKPYVKKYGLNERYSKIIIGDVRKTKLPKADCVIFGDVLEHMLKKDVYKVLKKAEKFKHMVVSIPVNSNSQYDNGNPYEKHISVWSEKNLRDTFKGFKQIFISNGVGCDMGVFLR